MKPTEINQQNRNHLKNLKYPTKITDSHLTNSVTNTAQTQNLQSYKTRIKDVKQLMTKRQRSKNLEQNKQNNGQLTNLIKNNVFVMKKQITLKRDLQDSVKLLEKQLKKQQSKKKLDVSINKTNRKGLISLENGNSARSLSSKKQKLCIFSNKVAQSVINNPQDSKKPQQTLKSVSSNQFNNVMHIQSNQNSKERDPSKQKKNMGNHQCPNYNSHNPTKISQFDAATNNLIAQKIDSQTIMFSGSRRPIKTTKQIKQLKDVLQSQLQKKKLVKLTKKTKFQQNR